VTEQYQNNPESVNNCVLFIQQRHNSYYYYEKDHGTISNGLFESKAGLELKDLTRERRGAES
jgi:hypothetical protein